MSKDFSYLRAIVICHGKSEKQICDFIKSNLRIRIHIESDKNGKKSIQITSLMKTLTGQKFKTLNKFINEFPDVKINSKKTKKFLDDDFRIFIIMDTDDCNDEQKNAFINKTMFEKHWAYKYIVPIYNSPNLEYALTKSKIPFEKKGEKRKEEYIKIFPTKEKYKNSETIQLKDFYDNLKPNKTTNLDEFIKFCLDIIN